MKRQILFVLVSIISLLFITSCGQQDADNANRENQMEEQMGDQSFTDNNFWIFDRDYTYEQREEFRSDVESAMNKLDNEISVLEEKANNATDETKEWYNSQIEDLRNQRNEISNSMQDFANVTEEKWGDFKIEITSVWKDIEKSWDQIAQEERETLDKVY